MAMDRFSEAYVAAQKVVKETGFPSDWNSVIAAAKELLAGKDGPNPGKATAVKDLRKKLKDGAKSSGSESGKKASAQIIEASKQSNTIKTKRAATFKMLKHLYLVSETGNQKLWVYAPPKAYKKWVFEEFDGLGETALAAKLDDEAELYSSEHRKVMAAAALQARKVCGKVQAELSIKPNETEVSSSAREKVKKWMFGDTEPSKKKMNAAIVKLRDGFKNIAVACGSGALIFSDEPVYRAKPGKWKNFGMIKTTEVMKVLYMMKGFLEEAEQAKEADRWLCVETIIHELSHKVVKTDDYAYDHHGLKPGGTKFPPGAGLDNADSWGYYACDVDDILPSSKEGTVYKIPTKVIKVWAG